MAARANRRTHKEIDLYHYDWQPDFITEEMVKKALEQVRVKKPNPLYDEIRFEEMTEGACVAMLHLGPFDEEPTPSLKWIPFARITS